MKILNLDALAAPKRTLTLGGVTYDVEEMTVENFIETTRIAEELETKGDKLTFADQIGATIGMIKRSVPDITEQQLRKLNLEQLTMVSKFLRGELDSETEAVESVEGEVKN